MTRPSLPRVGEVVGWGLVAGATAALLTQLLGTPSGPIAAMQSLTPWAIPVLVLVAVVAAVTERQALGLVGATVGIGYLALTAPLVFPDRGPGVRGDERLVVMAANLLYSNERIEEVGDVIAEVDPDLLAISEVTPQISADLGGLDLADRYPHRVTRPAGAAAGLLLWSKHPIASAGELDGVSRSITVTVDGAFGPVRVVLVHPTPPVFDVDGWNDDLATIPDEVAGSADPAIVLGDFNASWFHPPFRRLLGRADLLDAVVASGGGLAMTWPTDEWTPPFVTLDHVLVSAQLGVEDARTVAIPGSDHRAVVATVGAAAP